ASADDRADSEGRKLNRTQNAAQSMLTRHLLQQQAERFSRKQLASHSKDLPQKVVVWDRYRAITRRSLPFRYQSSDSGVGIASPTRLQMKYTGMPVAMMMKPGHVVAV